MYPQELQHSERFQVWILNHSFIPFIFMWFLEYLFLAMTLHYWQAVFWVLSNLRRGIYTGQEHMRNNFMWIFSFEIGRIWMIVSGLKQLHMRLVVQIVWVQDMAEGWSVMCLQREHLVTGTTYSTLGWLECRWSWLNFFPQFSTWSVAVAWNLQ